MVVCLRILKFHNFSQIRLRHSLLGMVAMGTKGRSQYYAFMSSSLPEVISIYPPIFELLFHDYNYKGPENICLISLNSLHRIWKH